MHLRNRFALIAAALAFLAVSLPASAHGTYCANPFQRAGTAVLRAGYGGAVAEFPVPAGYRLQIEYVSAGLRHASNDARGAFGIGTWAGGNFAWHPLPILTGYALSDRMASQPVALYADGGSLVKIEVSRASGTNVEATGRYAVTGCLYPAK